MFQLIPVCVCGGEDSGILTDSSDTFDTGEYLADRISIARSPSYNS